MKFKLIEEILQIFSQKWIKLVTNQLQLRILNNTNLMLHRGKKAKVRNTSHCTESKVCMAELSKEQMFLTLRERLKICQPGLWKVT